MKQPKQMLVIDDEEAIQDVIQMCLEEMAGWDVRLARSAHEGLRMAEADQPDAILLDIFMPDMDGITTFQQLQENPQTRSIPVILLTASLSSEIQDKFAAHGTISGVIAKPFDPIHLAEQISSLLQWDV